MFYLERVVGESRHSMAEQEMPEESVQDNSYCISPSSSACGKQLGSDLQGGLSRKFPREAVSQLEDSEMTRAGPGKEREESPGNSHLLTGSLLTGVPCSLY